MNKIPTLTAHALAGLLFSAAWFQAAHASDWRQYRGPDRNGASDEKGWHVSWPPKKVWSANVGIGYSSIVVSGKKAYTIGHKRGEAGRGLDKIVCLDAGTGRELWKHEYDCLSSRKDRTAEYPGPRSTPLIDGKNLYAVSLEGHLHCLDAETGAVKWVKDLKKYSLGELLYGFCASPIIDGDILICYVSGASMAFNKNTGKPLWRCRGGDSSWNGPSPVIAEVNGVRMVLFGEKSMVGARVDTGKKLWEVPLKRVSVSTPVVSGSGVFYSTYPNRGSCGLIDLSGKEPVKAWSHRKFQSYHVGTPTLWKGHLFGIDCSRTEYAYNDKKASSLRCLDIKTGKVKWTQKRMGWGQVIAADGKLLIQRLDGELILAEASAESYKELGRTQALTGPCWAIPALADGKIYCRNNKGDVVCLSATGETAQVE